MTKDKALKLALEALEEAWYHVGTFQPTEKAIDLYDEARTAIKEALAQTEQEQEPEWYHGIDVYGCNRFYHKTEDRTSEFNTPLYITPPQRTWIELTDEEITAIWQTDECYQKAQNFARAILRKAQEK